jgi:hypothetical protein
MHDEASNKRNKKMNKIRGRNKKIQSTSHVKKKKRRKKEENKKKRRKIRKRKRNK